MKNTTSPYLRVIRGRFFVGTGDIFQRKHTKYRGGKSPRSKSLLMFRGEPRSVETLCY